MKDSDLQNIPGRPDIGRGHEQAEHKTEMTDAAGAAPTEGSRLTDHRLRMRFEYRDLIEDLIDDGRRRGLFDNLSGSGKPLETGDNPFEGNMALSNRLLKDNDLRPAWLATRLEVKDHIERFRGDVVATWQQYEAAHRRAVGETQRAAIAVGWLAVCRGWEARIVEINKVVDSYNLRRPGSAFEVYKLRLDYELERAGARPCLSER